MTPHEQFLSRRQRYQPIALPPDLSEEELARDWTLSDDDRAEIGKYRKSFRLSLAIQLCAVRVYGRFFTPIHDISPRIANYLGTNSPSPPRCACTCRSGKPPLLEHRQHILSYLGFHKFDEDVPKRHWPPG